MGANETIVLQGSYAPIDQESFHENLEVIGEIPKDLNGIYVRNGPNRMFEAEGRYHWFDGDGMVHAVNFDEGKVTYRSRWVMTDSLKEEMDAGQALWKGVKEAPRKDRPDMPLKNTSNTDVKFHNGKLISMWYLGGNVYQIDPVTLETTGKLIPDPRLQSLPVSAHSRVDERTGEFIFFAYGKTAPYMHYGVINAKGELTNLTPIDLPGPRLPHDMAITENYSILHDLPLFYEKEALAAGRHKLHFHSDVPSRFGVIPRHGDNSQVQWFEAKPAYIYHVTNAWEEKNDQGETVIVMTGTPFRAPMNRDGSIDEQGMAKQAATLQNDFIYYEWRFNLATGQTEERVIDDILNTEFPMINSWMQGYKTRYSWHILMARSANPEEPRFSGIVRYDTETGETQAYTEGKDCWYSEAPFAPKDNWKEEDDGYLVGYVWNGNKKRSEVQIFDAKNIGKGPIARVILPTRVPNGFHSTWVSRERLKRGI